MQPVVQTDIPVLSLASRGKVRDVYHLSDASLLMVTTDRISAYDVIMDQPIPYKGVVLNQISLFWMDMFADLVKNHVIARDASQFPAELAPYAGQLDGRALVVKKAKPLPLECIVRGHITGSGWKDYQRSGMVCGHVLPTGLLESQKLEQPLFTPSTKAELGLHDENITEAQAREIVGPEIFERVRELSLALFTRGRDYAESKGIIIADTKFEFGIWEDEVILIDEALTPDSSRFWPMEGYAPGKSQPSFDKQFLRDWLSNQDWDKTPPPPALPDEVVQGTRDKYFEAYRRITGQSITPPQA